MTFPKAIPQSLNEYYGNPDANGDGLPSLVWESKNITHIVPPYQMFWSWSGQMVKSIAIHQKAASSLLRCLIGIRQKFRPDELAHYQLDQCAGGYNFRSQRGNSSKLSLHAYGAAIDLAPMANGMGKKWVDGAMMPLDAVAIFKAEGWRWGGDFKNPDCMHFQATI